MGRSPCCASDANFVTKGPWTAEEDEKLKEYIEEKGAGNWKNLPKLAGLNRCGKSCRLRWANYLRPDIKRGAFSEEEERMIIHLHSVLGNKWSAIAARLPGRTDNEIKNYWNTHLRKTLLKMGIDPVTHAPRTDLSLLGSVPNLIAAAASLSGLTASPLLGALHFPQMQLLQTLLQLQVVMANNSAPPNLDPNVMALQNLRNDLLGDLTAPSVLFNGTEAVAPMMNYYGGGSSSSTRFATPTATSTPSLVSASPENSTTPDQTHEPVSDINAICSPTSSKPFEDWEGLNLDDLDNDLGWKDVLNQICWSDALSREAKGKI